jgi:[amino group carrier protein]-lysine/ornithine hydrolase
VRPEPVATLEALLGHYSPTGQEASAVACLVAAMQDLGYQASMDAAGNAVGTIGSGRRNILLLGHIDTVPGNIPVRHEEDKLYGRGAVDAKGPLASFLFAAAQAGIHPDWSITVVGAVGEEGDSPGARHVCSSYQPAEMVVIGEPSGWQGITLGYKGSLWMSVQFREPASHTASGSGSVCDRVFSFWKALTSRVETWNQGKPREFERLTPSLRGFASRAEEFTQAASMEVNFRLPEGVGRESIDALVQESLSESGAVAEVTASEILPAYRAAKNTALVRAFLAAIRSNGGNPGFKLKTGSADMNLVGPAWGVPIVAYGPGDSSLDHTPDEHIELSEYLLGIKVLEQALETLQGLN